MKSLIEIFSKIEDPRMERSKHHNLIDIIAIAICATIAGADGFNEIEDWGKAKKKWLKKFLELPNGIPSHDTFNRVFSILNPKALRDSFLEWIESINMLLNHRIISADGKTLRRSFDRTKNKQALHLVSAWASEANFSLGQIQVNSKSNEITAIPQLLDILELSGAIVTLDAMGTQKGIAKKIVEKGANYVLALKKNHGDLYDDVDCYFKLENDDQFVKDETIEKDHGRVESRSYKAAKNINWLNQKVEWEGLNTVVQVVSKRKTSIGEEKTTLYFLTSLLPTDIHLIRHAIRSHWKIENSLHWCLDVIFREDESRIRNQNAAENMALLRKMALSVLKNASYGKAISLRRKRFLAGLDDSFLLKALNIKRI